MMTVVFNAVGIALIVSLALLMLIGKVIVWFLGKDGDDGRE